MAVAAAAVAEPSILLQRAAVVGNKKTTSGAFTPADSQRHWLSLRALTPTDRPLLLLHLLFLLLPFD